ncbi:MAG TPA: hypothetical protein VJ828_19485 [Lacipirellulaceae bacterium]|jgi:hypothetical protein|nr:hypothetical protein [Lacipirellulaceae bacterium]
MSTDANYELQSFHQFIGEQLSIGHTSLSPEEALELWRLENRSPEEYQADVEAIREALADMEAGDRGTPVEEYLAEFRTRRNLDS